MKKKYTNYTPLLFACLLLLFGTANLSAQTTPPNLNFTPVGTLPYTQELNDVWGYVDQTGVEYALVGTQTGTSIVSLATPSNPTEILFIPGFSSLWRDLKTWGDFAYVTADQGQEGLLIIDLSPLPSGTPTYRYWRPELTINTDTDTLNKAHNLYIDENGHCFIAGSNISGGETFILDVFTTPGFPIFRGSTAANYAHDAYARGDSLWTSDINDGLFSVYDISDPTMPNLLARQATPRNFAHNAWISDDGNTLFTTDEKANAWIGAYDVSDLSNIQEIDRWRTPTDNVIPHNVHVDNDFLVTSYYTDGIVVLDGSRPDNLIEVGRYDTYNGTPTTGFYGAWGAYPFLPSGLVLVSDINTGLHILQPSYQRAAWLEGVVTDQSNGNNLFDVLVEISSTFAADNTDLSGNYKTGMGTGGTYNVTFRKADYIPQTFTLTLVNGQVTTQNVQLVPATAFTLRGRVVDSLQPTQGIANALVSLQSSLYDYKTTADANGNFSIQIKNDAFELLAGNWGHYTKLTNLNLTDSTAAANPIVIELRQGYQDEFVLDLGWTIAGDATSGNWERAIAEDVFSWQGMILPADADITTDIGEYAFITGNNDFGQAGTDDLDNGTTILISPSTDLSNYSAPKLSFYYYINKPFPPNTEDSLTIEVTNGTDTVTVWSTLGAQYDWSPKQEVILTDYLTVSNNMHIFFKINDSSPANILEAGIDVVAITDTATMLPIQRLQPLAATQINYYPNPFGESLQIEYHSEATTPPTLQVHNTLGQLIEQRSLSTLSGNIQLGQSWSTGIYWVTIGNKTVKVLKL